SVKQSHMNCVGGLFGWRARKSAARTGVEPDFNIPQISTISAETCGNQRVNCIHLKPTLCTNRAELRSSSVRICPKALRTLINRLFAAGCLADGMNSPRRPFLYA